MTTAIARTKRVMPAFDRRINAMQAMTRCGAFYAPYGGDIRNLAPKKSALLIVGFFGVKLTDEASGSLETGRPSGTIR